MFEIYAVIAIMLLLTGLISLAHFVCYIQTNIKNKPTLWTLILESTVTILLSIFYICCAVILSQGSVATFVDNDSDLAIINDTFHNVDNDIPTFYNKNEQTPLDRTNEIEDTRNNKDETSPSKFLENYQHLVQTSNRKKVQNGTKHETTSYERMLNHATDEATMDFLEHPDCFLRLFFHQALLVHSFLTCAISLLNTCHSFTNENPPGTQEKSNAAADDNSSETFGEKILDNVSDNSSQNAAPVGPLFDKDSLSEAVSNLDVFEVKNGSQKNITSAASSLDVFKVKKITQQNLTKGQCPQRATEMEEGKMLAAGKCGIMLTLPAVFVAILYFVMKSGDGRDLVAPDRATFDLLPHLNMTASDMAAVNLVKIVSGEERVNDSHQKELDLILRRVYAIINRLKEEQQEGANAIPAVKGQYLYGSSQGFNKNVTNNYCVSDDDKTTKLKVFDFLVFVVFFFVVILYAKVVATKQSGNNYSNEILNKCTVAFLVLWMPCILETIFSIFTTDGEPNIVSGLLLLVGNVNRLYSTFQSIGNYKKNCKGGGLIKPASGESH